MAERGQKLVRMKEPVREVGLEGWEPAWIPESVLGLILE